MALIDFQISVTTMRELLEGGNWGRVLILNEYDQIINEQSYLVHNNSLSGLWHLKGKKVFAFSATSSVSHERLVANFIDHPKALKFKSEYEMVRGSSPNVDPGIHSCEDEQALLMAMESELVVGFES